MKKLHYALLFLWIPFCAFAQEEEKLPKETWEEIVEINNNERFPILKWKGDIKIKLIGNYSKTDSITIARIARKLDSITETISIGFSENDNPNFKIIFLKEGDEIKTNYKRVTSRSSINTTTYITNTKLFIQNTNRPDNYYINTLESRIAKQLIQGGFEFYHIRDLKPAKRKSVFNPINGKGKSTKSLNEKDIAILKEIYKPNFEKKLELAKKEFSYIIENMENAKSLRRDKSLWWVKNPIAIIFFPTLLLFLMFLFFTSKVKNFLDKNLNNNFLKILLVSLIAVCFFDILVIFIVSFYDHLRTPRSFGFSIIRYDTVITTFVVSLFCFPFLFLFRFLEKKIEKTRVNIITKTSLIFLSTGLLPFVIILVIVISTIKEGQNHQGGYTTLSYLFLGIMIIASIRALISYFIFKERNLIVENETKLSHLRELKTKAELKSLQSQINPHFLYNSLNSIASLAPIDAIKTQKMAHSLSDLFKYSINRKGQKMSTIKDEIEMVQAYLEIEKIRFEERLNFTIKVDETLLNHKIPLFIIQPLVENAIKHGVSKSKDNGEVVLNIEKETNAIVITVSDNGPDFPEGLVSGHGLQTVYDLLRLSYGDKASLNWTNMPQKMITITIPKNS